MSRISVLKKSGHNSNYDLFALIFYAYTFLVSIFYGHQTDETIILVLYGLVGVFILIQEHAWNYEILATAITVSKVLILGTSSVFFVMYIYLGDLSSLRIITFFSPIFLLIHYVHLTKNTSISTDKWIPVQSIFSQYYRSDKIVLIEPHELSLSQVPVEESTTHDKNSHKLRSLSNSLGQVRFKAFTEHYNTISFHERSFLILKKDDDRLPQYVVPNHENFHQLSQGLQKINYGMTLLKTNTLTDFFISNLVDSLRSNKLEIHTNLSTYTNQRKAFSVMFSSEDLRKASASHIWTHVELRIVASRIISAFLDDNKKISQLRLEWYLINSIEKLSQRLNLTSQILASFWTMLTKLNSNKTIFNRQRVVSSIQSLCTTSSIVLNEIIVGEQPDGAEVPRGDVLKHKMSDIIENRLDDYEIFCQTPTEKFIEIHDRLHNLLINSEINRVSLEKLDVVFDRIIRHLIIQLKKTSLRQNGNALPSLSQQDLIDRRSGIVVGVTMALNLVVTFLEGQQ